MGPAPIRFPAFDRKPVVKFSVLGIYKAKVRSGLHSSRYAAESGLVIAAFILCFLVVCAQCNLQQALERPGVTLQRGAKPKSP